MQPSLCQTASMKTKLAAVVGALVLAALACVVIYQLGYRKAVQDDIVRGDAQFKIAVLHGLYRSAQSGDLQQVQSNAGIFLLGEVRAYEYRFGPVTGTNNFATRFHEAKQIADRVERQLIPLSSVFTNVPHSPNLKGELVREKP